MLTIMTAGQAAAARRAANRRAAKGEDVRFHNGARSKPHLSARDKARRDRRSWRHDLD
jgi:hypothetical protein